MLRHPLTVLASVPAGLVLGANSAELTALVEPIGDLYLSFLQMIASVLLPLAVITSIGGLVKKKMARRHVASIFLTLAIFMTGVVLVVIAVGIVSKPLLGVDFETKKAVSRMLLEKSDTREEGQESFSRFFIREIDSRQGRGPERESWFAAFIMKVIPTNIVSSLARGETLRIVFFALVFGLMLQHIPVKKSDKLLNLTEGVFASAKKMAEISLYFLPFGMVSLMAVEFRGLSPLFFLSLLKFVAYIYLSSATVFALATILVWRRLGGPYLAQIRALKDALVVAFVSQEKLPAIPATFAGLKKLDLDEERANLVISLFFFLSDYAYLMAFTAAGYFSFQLYDTPLTLPTLIALVFLLSIAVFSTLGAPDILAVGMVGLALKPLGVPADAATLLLLVLGSILYPVLVMTDIYISCAAAVIIAKR